MKRPEAETIAGRVFQEQPNGSLAQVCSPAPDLVAIAGRLHSHDRPEGKFQRLQNRAFEAVKRMPVDELAALHPDAWLADALRELDRTGPCSCGQLFLGGAE